MDFVRPGIQSRTILMFGSIGSHEVGVSQDVASNVALVGVRVIEADEVDILSVYWNRDGHVLAVCIVETIRTSLV